MRIGELARRAGVSASRIRFYEKVGLLAPAGRLANGYRDYGVDDHQRIILVERAKRLGFSLREIASFLPHQGEGPLTCSAMLELLAAKRLETDRLMLKVSRRRRDIADLMDQLRSGASHAKRAASGGGEPPPDEPRALRSSPRIGA